MRTPARPTAQAAALLTALALLGSAACTGELSRLGFDSDPDPHADQGLPPKPQQDQGQAETDQGGAPDLARPDMGQERDQGGEVLPPLPACSEQDFWPVSSPLRRLTNRELINTLTSVFYGEHDGESSLHRTDRLLPEVANHLWTNDSFINKAAYQGVSPLQLERHLDFVTWYVRGTQLKPDGTAPATDQGPNYRRSNLPTQDNILYGTTEKPGWSPCKPARDAPLEELQACGDQIIEATLPKLFRRPLAEDELEEHRVLLRALIAEQGFKPGLDALLIILLQSPDLLYRPEFGTSELVAQDQATPLDDYELASRLSYFLWQDIPDEELRRAASAGELRQEQGLETQARRMLAHPRARHAMADFFRGWLKLDKLDQLSGNLSPWHKNQTLRGFVHADSGKTDGYRTWTLLHPSLKESVLRYIDWAFWEANSWQELVAGEQMFANSLISQLYSLPDVPLLQDPPGNNDGDRYRNGITGNWQRVTMPQAERRGLFTQPGLLTMTSHEQDHSPIYRGVFLMSALLCQEILAPPNPEPSPAPDAMPCTTRDEVAMLHSANAGCQVCHTMIDGLGFSYEHYDELGLWRDTENGCDVNASVTLPATGPFQSDVAGDYNDGVELGAALAQSKQVQACMVTHWLRYALGQDEIKASSTRNDDETLRRHQCQQHQITRLVDQLETSDGDLQDLVVSLVLSPSFRLKAVPRAATQGGNP